MSYEWAATGRLRGALASSSWVPIPAELACRGKLRAHRRAPLVQTQRINRVGCGIESFAIDSTLGRFYTPRWRGGGVKHLLRLGLSLLASMSLWAQTTTNSYTQTYLTSDVSGVAPTTEPLLQNPWGLSRPTGATAKEAHWWAADQRTGVSTLYNADGSFVPLTITIPPASGSGTGSPTGTVFFNKYFLFATLDGTIQQWFAGSKPSPAGTG